MGVFLILFALDVDHGSFFYKIYGFCGKDPIDIQDVCSSLHKGVPSFKPKNL